MTLFVAGFATFVQARRIGSIGSGLLSIQGSSFAFLPPIFSIIAAGNAANKTPEETLALILGVVFFSSFIQIILSRFLQFAKTVFPPLVKGTAVTLIGLTLIRCALILNLVLPKSSKDRMLEEPASLEPETNPITK